MGNITLITGGCRSGKSSHAQARAEQAHARRIYIATCPILDDEMADRIERHQQERVNRNWTTLEAPVDLAEAFQQLGEASVLVDCLTLWVNNLLFEAEQNQVDLDEASIAVRTQQLVQAARQHPYDVVLVTNEVGSGIVPENALARRFRDLAGRCNQLLAHEAEEVVLMVSGIAVPIKPAPITHSPSST